ncbi:MAG: DUF5716 family protein [Candidatus Accumulibacter sp.]|jgi:hypothetical protein|nr:DUF5716 family protein [Accumulibacter sp.]
MFTADNPRFFRPLTLKKRRLIAACIRAFHERLYGSHADYRSILGREELRDLFVQTLQDSDAGGEDGDETIEEGFAPGDLADEQKMASAFIRQLLADGWLETAEDRVRLVTAYRFTRAGKIFAQALAQAERPRERTRQRNMRSCKNALAAFIDRRDVEDLLDAHEYAHRVISDLSEDIELFHELARNILADAYAQGNWDDFLDVIGRFQNDFSPRLVYDSAERHRLDIAALTVRLGELTDVEVQAVDAELARHAPWAVQAAGHGGALGWLLERIEEMVAAACQSKQPELFRAMESYIRRHVMLLSQSLFMDANSGSAALSRLIRKIGEMPPTIQEAWLADKAVAIAPVAVALYDPATLRLKTAAERVHAQTVSIVPEITREERLRQFLRDAEERAFSLSWQEIVDYLLGRMRGNGQLRLSELPVDDALQALSLLRAVEAARASDELEVERRESEPLENAILSGTDYTIRRRHVG